MHVTREIVYRDTVVPAGSEVRRATALEVAALPMRATVASLTRGGWVWCWIAGAVRRVPQEDLSDYRPIEGGYGGPAYRRGAP